MLVFLFVSTALAHITLESPKPVTEAQKQGPCGAGPHARGPQVSVFAPGDTITVRWRETINHPSHYRISFDSDGDDSFADPQTPEDFYVNDAVLLDEIPDEEDGVLKVEVTLPDIECENCTLQVIQLMLDKPPFEPGTNDIYYQCADIALRAGTPPVGEDPPTTDDIALEEEEKGCGCQSASLQPGWLLAGALLLLVRRSR